MGEDTCPFCWVAIAEAPDGANVIQTPCGHKSHVACMNRHNTAACPLCDKSSREPRFFQWPTPSQKSVVKRQVPQRRHQTDLQEDDDVIEDFQDRFPGHSIPLPTRGLAYIPCCASITYHVLTMALAILSSR